MPTPALPPGGTAAAAPLRTGCLRDALVTPAIRQRITDYLGGPTLETATCCFLGRLAPDNPSRFDRHSPREIHSLLKEDCELARSLEDEVSMLFHLDIEYVNFDDPFAAFLDPQRTFLLQEPLVRIIEKQLLGFGIQYLHVVTGQGHHFVWKIALSSPVARAIADLAVCRTANQELPSNPLFQHVGLLMEYLAHLIKAEAAPACAVPVEITAQHVGPGRSGAREMLSIDISEYGDPLPSRMVRIPYTVYRKPWVSGLMDTLVTTSRVPEFFTLPLHEMDISQLISIRHDPSAVTDLAQRAGTIIPTCEAGTLGLLKSYVNSSLASSHREFYSVPGDPFPTSAVPPGLPPCAQHILTFPNDLLLKPSGLQLITRCLLALHWHPRKIARFITAKFLDPHHDWQDQWLDYDPALRAEFYVRLFTGQITRRLERGIDFNCVSQQEKHFCWNPDNCSLEPFHRRIYSDPSPHTP